MKFLGRDCDAFSLELTLEERALLLHLLALYPLVPASYHRLTRDKKLPRREENQQLLDDALQAQRAENQRALGALLGDSRRFVETAGQFRVSVQRGELEWLLQVVNDVRVGCWLALGSPGYETKKPVKPTKETMRHALFMDLAGAFEMFFLGLINGDVPPEPPE